MAEAARAGGGDGERFFEYRLTSPLFDRKGWWSAPGGTAT
jgi:hypothetical protein